MFPFDPPFDVFKGSEGNIVKKRVKNGPGLVHLCFASSVVSLAISKSIT